MKHSESLWAVLGATGSGKTDLALRLCEAIGGEVVSVDSAQLFRGMNIGTATPSEEEQARATHHIIDVIEPDTQWSAVSYMEAAEAAITDIRARGLTPVLCGGAGLWFRALRYGVFEAPEIEPALRKEIREAIDVQGSVVLHAELEKVDPATAQKIHPNDKQRIGRALEVFRQTGKRISDFQSEHRFANERHRISAIALEWPVTELRERLAIRTQAMFDAGWVDEVCALLEQGVRKNGPGLSCIGYREIVRHLDGEASLDETIEKTVIATRRYAKRQKNWFRGEAAVRWIDPGLSTEAVMEYLSAG